MTGRFEMRSAAAAVLLIVIGCAVGCSESPVRGRSGASLTIDGAEQGRNLPLQCNQLQTSWFLDIADANNEATAIVDVKGDKASVETVKIRGFGQFSGSYFQGADGSADVTMLNRIFTITGTIMGTGTADHKARTVQFKIIARC